MADDAAHNAISDVSERKLLSLEADQHTLLSINDLYTQTARLDARTATLEASIGLLRNLIPAPPIPSEPPSIWQKIGAFITAFFDIISKIIIPLAVVWLTWSIKDSVESALKERELEVTTGKAMQDALTTLQEKDGITQPRADAAALVLASMGKASILPLISAHNGGSLETTIAVENAFPVLDITHRAEVCEMLKTVIEDKSGRFRIATYKFAVRQIGMAQCSTAQEALTNKKKLLDHAGDNPGLFLFAPTPAEVDDLQKVIRDALKLLPLS